MHLQILPNEEILSYCFTLTKTREQTQCGSVVIAEVLHEQLHLILYIVHL